MLNHGELEVMVEGITTCRYRDDMPRIWEDRLWVMYVQSFGSLDTFQDQMCYDPETFRDALRDPDYVKFVICEDERPRGMALATNDMIKAEVAYINGDYLRRRYPRETEEQRFYYVTSIFIDLQCRGMGYVKSLLYAMLLFMREGGRLAGFDFCESKEFLAGVIRDLSRDRAVNIPVNPQRLDAQVYYVLELETTQDPLAPGHLAEVMEFGRIQA